MLLDSVIAQICAGLIGSQHDACTSALQATAVQTHVSRDVGALENYGQQYVMNAAVKMAGQKPLGAVFVVTKIIREKRVSYKIIHNRGVVPDVTPDVGIDSCSLNLHWEF